MSKCETAGSGGMTSERGLTSFITSLRTRGTRRDATRYSELQCDVSAERATPTDFARLVDMPRHDTNLTTSRVDDTGAVGSHQA